MSYAILNGVIHVLEKLGYANGSWVMLGYAFQCCVSRVTHLQNAQWRHCHLCTNGAPSRRKNGDSGLFFRILRSSQSWTFPTQTTYHYNRPSKLYTFILIFFHFLCTIVNAQNRSKFTDWNSGELHTPLRGQTSLKQICEKGRVICGNAFHVLS